MVGRRAKGKVKSKAARDVITGGATQRRRQEKEEAKKVKAFKATVKPGDEVCVVTNDGTGRRAWLRVLEVVDYGSHVSVTGRTTLGTWRYAAWTDVIEHRTERDTALRASFVEFLKVDFQAHPSVID